MSDLVSASPAFARCVGLAERVARTGISVLISGESGTGKEVIARLIHRASDRASGPFVAINCAAIPEQMLEAVLFGHEKGAFTGAHQSKEGKFEQASGGTLLLDEISEMALPLQAKLLRVLQEREVERVGGHRLIPVDVRVIATTNRDLKAAIGTGAFREDLYYRLSVFPLRVPALKERAEDVPALAAHFLKRYATGPRVPELTPAAEEALRAHTWPGNVRELENAVQRALVMNQGDRITPDDLGLTVPRAGFAMHDDGSLEQRLLAAEVKIVSEALERNAGRRRPTARALGISERTLRHKLKLWRDSGIVTAA
jgi:two-component system response regulator FlrC